MFQISEKIISGGKSKSRAISRGKKNLYLHDKKCVRV